jgi:CRP/FNR family transcriptional regulator, cyclic AMP receptor protein
MSAYSSGRRCGRLQQSHRQETGGRAVEAVLAQVPLFAALDADSAASLEKTLTSRTVPRGRVVFREGDPGDRLFIVLDGKVKISRTATDGRENLLAVLGAAEMFGELSLFDPGPRTATVTTVTAATLASLDHDDLRPLLSEHPRVAVQLLQALAQRLRRTNEAKADLVFTDVPGRVAKALLDLAEKFGIPEAGGTRVRHDLTQEELAQLVGASRETVNKALSEFAHRGWLRIDGRSVLLLDPDRLARRAR